MAFEYAGGTNRNDLYTGITTRRGLLDSIATTLAAAGWTSSETKAFVRLVFTGQPANNDTVTLGGKTYTFQTVLTNVDGNVAIGASALITYQNLKAAINLESGAGTKYAAATTAHSTLECGTYFYNDIGPQVNPTSNTLKVRAKTAGTGGRGIACSESTANMTLTDGTTSHDGYHWLSAKNVQGLRHKVFGFDSGEVANPPDNAVIRLIVGDMHDVVRSHTNEPTSTGTDSTDPTKGFRVGVSLSTSWRVIANKYCFYVLVPGSSANLSFFYSVMPVLQTPLKPVVITAATNATPIAITTNAVHGWTTGQQVCIRNGEGNTAVNGTFTITVTGTTTATLDSSVGNGTYTASSAVAGRVSPRDLVSECLCAGNNGATLALFRTHCGAGAASQEYFVSVNGENHTSGSQTACPTLYGVIPCNTDIASAPSDWANGKAGAVEPFIGFGSSSGGNPVRIGQLPDMALVMKAFTIDQTATFDGHNWWGLTNNNGGSTTVAEATAFVVVP